MKLFVRQIPGYSMHTLENIWDATRIRSDFFDQQVRPAGVCFSTGADSLEMAQSYSRQIWGFGSITYYVSKMSDTTWREFALSISLRITETTNVGYILHRLELASVKNQELLAGSITAEGPHQWFVTVEDPMRLIPELRKQLVVYMGLDGSEKMQFLVQDEHLIYVDKEGQE
jgi:hypothetical protein